MKEICRKALSFLKSMTVKQKIISASVVAVILITAILVPIIIVNTGKCDHVFDNACDTTCNECGETREVGAHDYNAADCDTPKTCKICGVTDGEALGHTAEADDGNCTTEIKCATCGTVLTSGKTQHVAHADDGDCTTPVTCTECSTVITAAKSHDFSGAWEKDSNGHWHVCKNEGCSVTDTKADHTSDGAATEEKAEKCTVCEYVITPELDHTHNHNIPKYDTENHWIECACGDKSAVTAHTANNDDGDCTTAVTCSGCSHIMTAAKAHTSNADDGDCTTDITCKDCGKVTTAGNASHTPHADDGDCTTAVTCSLCGNVTTPAKNHDFSGAWEKDESGHWHVCKNDGCSVTDTKASHISNDVENEPGAQLCAECGYESTVVIPHIHEWGTVKYEWNANYTKCTATRACIKNEQHVETESATITSEITIAASCVSNGEIVYTATFTNENFATQTETVEIPASADDHEYGELTVEWNADYSDCVVSRYCSAGEHGDEELTKTISDNNGVKTVSVYDGSEDKIAVYVYKPKTSGNGYYLYSSEIKTTYYVNGSYGGNISVKTYDEEGNVLSEGNKLIFEGFAPDSDDSEFG